VYGSARVITALITEGMDDGEAPTRAAPAGADTSTLSAGRTPSDPEAFERLTIPHLPDILRFARSLTRDAAQADDLVQETYLRALHGWHTFREGSDPRRWLFTVCHHAFLRGVRRERRYVPAPEHDPELDSMATAVAHWNAQEAGVAEAVERMDLKPAIERALETLAAHYRVAVLLVDVEGLSYEEAADVLGVAVGTVRSRLFRGRRLLQDLLFAYAQDAGFAVRRADAAPHRPSSGISE
jgi:RNA polymerase sigma-70 factor (ECF subfamily)